MERIDAFRTNDGQIFTEKRAAVKHLDNAFGAIITAHASKIARVDKYSDAITYLIDALPALVEAHKLKCEMEQAESIDVEI